MRYSTYTFPLLFVFGYLVSVRAKDSPASQGVVVSSPFIQEFPCSDCHDSFKQGKIQLPLKKGHQHIRKTHPMERSRHCTLCHHSKKTDKLVLLNSASILMAQANELCGQCHGEKHRDWKMGIHGKQIGQWNGRKFRYNCTECHNPHSPKFRTMKASSPPVKPKFLIDKEKSPTQKNLKHEYQRILNGKASEPQQKK